MPKRKLIKPNFKLLRDAYAIFDGIPEQKINLGSILTKRGVSTECGTIACGMGFLALHPQFQAMGLEMPGGEKVGSGLLYKNDYIFYSDAAVKVFGLTYQEAIGIFCVPYCSQAIYDKHLQGVRNDKDRLLKRIVHFLKSKNQPISNAIKQ